MAGLFVAGMLAYGIGVYAFTQFLAPIQAEFGWNRAVLGGLMSAFWLAAPFVLIASYAIDLAGLRAVVFVGALLEATGLIVMTRLSSPVEFFLIRFCMGAGKCLVVTPLPIAVARWFRRRTGFAFAIALCGWHVGGFVMAPLAEKLISAYGWRTAAVVLAALLLAGMMVATYLMRPPSQAMVDSPGNSREMPVPVTSFAPLWTLALIGCGTIVFYAGYAAFLSQLAPMLADIGLGPRLIGLATGSVAICAMAGVLLGGLATQLLSPRIAVTTLLAIMAGVEYLATTLPQGATLSAVAAFVVPLGFLIGGGDPILIEALRTSVPLDRFGRAYGWWYLLCLASLAAVPVLIGAFFDAHASYRAVFLAMSVASILVAVAFVATRGRRTAGA
jgi:MFS family permease